ncbi:hypothetical protein A3D78_04740 [Candidatus Gottesmanbacteria bacterium RIFCSPHIGHO2_02_FULL_39_14]|uniref:DUF5666 domain-containing protein n=2 Tax=Candidatus Gottesmaniibacteriota TaxID=1752720 RepID=A0A1F5ZTN1_9BACT|nr:MAG: hypothetical protein A3D78_04740 [Candidatus Gottesmanbacteria bacterium RIFCSPHIGHO2_02_FULL_39_14]OGG30964.1 MAG: hypothetical protein A3I51_02250 [Candidatus Gottesmanbacteria bacterium RIFCSPLOWO2_02_FULL_38_8]
MKEHYFPKIIIAVLLMIISISASPSFAQTKTPFPTSKPSLIPTDTGIIDKLKQIEILKEKIATRVAEVRNQQKGAMFGKIISVENNLITLQSPGGEQKFTFSEDTLVFKMENKTKTEGKITELKPGITISVMGNYNETKENLLAKYLYIQENLVRINGKIAEVDKANFTLNVRAKDTTKLIDFEKYTVTSIYIKGKGNQKGGFSKFKLGDTVFISAIPNPKEENRYSALRIINLPASVITPTQSVSPTPTP